MKIIDVRAGTVHPLALLRRVFRALFIRKRVKVREGALHYYRR